MIDVIGERSDILVSADGVSISDDQYGRERTHLLIHKPEGQRLVADECLIVTFAVSNALLAMSPIRQCVDNITNVPLIVLFMLEKLYPHIRDGHRQSVIKSNACHFDGLAKKWHSGYIFRDRDHGGVKGAHRIVGLKQH